METFNCTNPINLDNQSPPISLGSSFNTKEQLAFFQKRRKLQVLKSLIGVVNAVLAIGAAFAKFMDKQNFTFQQKRLSFSFLNS
jgi:hypothetical protein